MSDCETRKLKVVFVSDGYPTDYHPMNGVFLHRAIKTLAQSVQVSVIHLRAWKLDRPIVESRQWEGIPVISLAIPQFPFRMSLHLNTKILARLGFSLAARSLRDVDILHSTGVYPAGYITSRWSRYTNRPHVTHAIGADVHLYLPAAKWLRKDKDWLGNIDGVACVGQTIKSQLMLLAGNLPNVRVIYRGVDTDQFTPLGVRDGPQTDLPPIRFLFMGGFGSWNKKDYNYNRKGGLVLLDAWRKMETQLGESSLLIVGPGTDSSHLKSWLASLQRPDSVFLFPTISPNKVPDLLRASDVVLIPSLREGVPNLVYEAQACGRPVLGSDADGIPEVVINGETGLIIPKGDPDALAQGMLWFHLHQDEIARMGSNARQHIFLNFSINQAAQEMLSLFKVAIEYHQSTKHGMNQQVGK
jgi:glycosyltransferase involved in cell wall biosynthesis